jgi:hypothetical protein
MKVSELIAQLQMLPQELEVMLPCEANVDHALRVGIVQVVKTQRDLSGTPIGNYQIIDDYFNEVTTGNPFPVVVIDLASA